MHAVLKPLAEQVIVITGASSGHGLATACKGAAAGARVMLAARDEAALAKACEDIRSADGIAEFAVCDVGSERDVEALAAATVARFGGFDTWVNNAGVGIYADALDISLDEHRQLFETNYWGTVHGSLVAVRHLRDKEDGGALINVGSVNGDMGGPLMSAYNASKHAVKGFTELAPDRSSRRRRAGVGDAGQAERHRYALPPAWPQPDRLRSAPAAALIRPRTGRRRHPGGGADPASLDHRRRRGQGPDDGGNAAADLVRPDRQPHGDDADRPRPADPARRGQSRTRHRATTGISKASSTASRSAPTPARGSIRWRRSACSPRPPRSGWRSRLPIAGHRRRPGDSH